MSAITLLIRIPQHYNDQCLKKLDGELQIVAPACIPNDPWTGVYTPDENGLYKVKLMVDRPMERHLVEDVLREYKCQIVS